MIGGVGLFQGSKGVTGEGTALGQGTLFLAFCHSYSWRTGDKWRKKVSSINRSWKEVNDRCIIVMSHIGWGGEQTTIYKGVETFS